VVLVYEKLCQEKMNPFGKKLKNFCAKKKKPKTAFWRKLKYKAFSIDKTLFSNVISNKLEVFWSSFGGFPQGQAYMRLCY